MSTEVTTEQMNYVIGVFDGRGFSMSHISDYTAESAPKMKYHTSWDWLMRVVEKIEDMPTAIRIENEPNQMENNYSVTVWVDPEDEPIIQACECSKIKADYKAVYQFITWYNQQKQTNEQ